MPDKYVIPILIAGSILLPMFMFFVTTFVIISKSSHRRLQIEKQQLEFQYERQILQTKLEVQEKGLNQLSQEIHDNIGQLLTSVHANLITALNTKSVNNERLIEASKNQVSTALKDLRNVSQVLNSQYINNIGLEDSIRKEIDYLSSYHSITFDICAENTIENLSPDKELMVFRIAQEALANILKHAHAKEVTISLNESEELFTMEIRDDGVGFSNPGQKVNGIGLITMKQRAELMDGSLKIESTKNVGTCLTLRIPLYE